MLDHNLQYLMKSVLIEKIIAVKQRGEIDEEVKQNGVLVLSSQLIQHQV